MYDRNLKLLLIDEDIIFLNKTQRSIINSLCFSHFNLSELSDELGVSESNIVANIKKINKKCGFEIIERYDIKPSIDIYSMPKEQAIQKLREEYFTYRQIGELYGVSKQAVNLWAEQAGIELDGKTRKNKPVYRLNVDVKIK